MSRHRSRHRAVQVLYQCDLMKASPEEAIRHYYGGLYTEESEEAVGNDTFMEELVRGVTRRMPEIDRLIGSASENWRMERMSAVDRNILRLAVYEMLDGRLAPAVVIDEALELARRFSGDDATRFLNGILDSVRQQLPDKGVR